MTDPFATAPTNEEFEAQEQEAPTTTTDKKENKSMAENTEGKVVVTLKGGKGYEAPWIVIHADSIEDANIQVNNSNLADLIEQTKKVSNFFNGGASTQATNGPKGQPQGATQAPGGATPPEGYVFRSGVGKNGRPWQAFMPEDRNSNLEVIWLDKNGNPRS